MTAFGFDGSILHHAQPPWVLLPARSGSPRAAPNGDEVKYVLSGQRTETVDHASPDLASAVDPPGAGSTHQNVRELFAAHAPFVAKFLSRMGAPEHEIEDLVQDVFLVAHARGGFVEREAKATTWLGAIAFRVWSSERRRFRRHAELPNESALAQAEAEGFSPAEAAVNNERVVRIRKVLDRIDDNSRAILLLVDLEGGSCVEVAEALNIPVGTVYSRLHTARKRFAHAYERLSKAERKRRGRES